MVSEQFKRFLGNIYIVIFIICHALRGEYCEAVAPGPYSLRWLQLVQEEGVRVYQGPLPSFVGGVSFPPVPLIVMRPEWGAYLLLHEYGHLVCGPFSSEESADAYARCCMLHDRLIENCRGES